MSLLNLPSAIFVLVPVLGAFIASQFTQQGIKLANTLRQAAAVEELYYSPSLRETIAYTKLVQNETSPKDAAQIVFGNVYAQWGNIEVQKVNDIITSMYEK